MKKILILGYFGYINQQIDGQTVKTRNIYYLLKEKQTEINALVSYFDTQSFKSSKFNILKMLFLILRSDKIFYLGAQNNLKYIFPFIFLISSILRKDIHYIVVGGWLVEFLKKNTFHRFILKKIKSIYPENETMCQQLNYLYGFNNTKKLHNFRIVKPINSSTYTHSSNNKIRLVFMARVQKMKGTEILFKIAKKIKKEKINNIIIDIYGPISKDYNEEFNNKISENKDIINYKGILAPDKIHETIINYDCMLFPTKYFTEGFPGSILDAYISEIPVIVTKWKYAEEFVEHNQSGLICEFNNDEDFLNNVFKFINDKNLMSSLKSGVKDQAKKYSPSTAWEILKKSLK